MLERIDPQLHRNDARPAAGAEGDRRGRGGAAAAAVPPVARIAEDEPAAEAVEETLARLAATIAATIADVERLAQDDAPLGAEDMSADAHAVAARIRADAAAALAAQAAIGPAGVRLVLEPGELPKPE
ncbi:MAG: hypothetical protein JOY99_18120 [Sphingomonadaceae bacterium]|nr:hypothetical protein [Sphingomonadaceae bacterium]